MDKLANYGSDDDYEDSPKYEQPEYPERPRVGERSTTPKLADVNYDDVGMDLSEDSDGSGKADGRRGKSSESKERRRERRESPKTSKNDRARDDGRARDRHHDRDEDRSRNKYERDRDEEKGREKYDRDEEKGRDKYEREEEKSRDRYEREEEKGRDRYDRDEEKGRDRYDRDEEKGRDRYDRDEEKGRDRYDRDDEKGRDKRDRDRDDDRSRDKYDRDREEIDHRDEGRHRDRDEKYRREKERDDGRQRERHREERRSKRSGSKEKLRSRSPAHRPQRNDSRDGTAKYPGYSRRYEKTTNKMAHLEKMGIEIKTPENQYPPEKKEDTKASNPNENKFFLPGVTGRLREQMERRKLLWQKKEPEKVITNRPQAVAAGSSKTGKVWETTIFAQDQDGKQASKFKRLMGIKDSSSSGGKTVPDIVKKQEELFSTMEQQYEVARTATHTMRGVGLGFGSYQR